MSSHPSVQLEDVTKRFGDFPAVRALSLDIAAGEFFTLLGPSGCGKTTTLRMVAGFEEPTEGRIRIDGRRRRGRAAVQAADEHRLPELRALPAPERRGQRRLRPAPQGRRRRPRSRGRVGEELERVGLAAEAKRKPRQLSGGQQQRVALARALINRPAVLLLDEPLGALDLKLRKGLQIELKGIQRDVGITFVYVTHDQEEALTMSDRIAVMNRGVIEQLAAPEDVYERPAHRVRGRVHRRLEPAARARSSRSTGSRSICASTAGRRSGRAEPACSAATAATRSCARRS